MGKGDWWRNWLGKSGLASKASDADKVPMFLFLANYLLTHMSHQQTEASKLSILRASEHQVVRVPSRICFLRSIGLACLQLATYPESSSGPGVNYFFYAISLYLRIHAAIFTATSRFNFDSAGKS
jgi:hypothetical protein